MGKCLWFCHVAVLVWMTVLANNLKNLFRCLVEQRDLSYVGELCSESERCRKKEKILVIVTGSLRGGELVWQTLYQNLLDVNEADLLLITDDAVPAAYQNSSLFRRAKYVWTVHKYKDWADAFDVVNGNNSSWREPVISSYLTGNDGSRNNMLGGLGNASASGAIIFVFRWFLMQKLRNSGLVSQYDRFVVTRSDQFYLCPENISELDPEYMWVPEGQDWGGITDRHYVANARDILPSLNILPPLLANPMAYQHLLRKRDKYNSEKYLLHIWTQHNLKPFLRRYKRRMFVAANPSVDETRWGTISAEPTREGVHYKYYREYGLAALSCGRWGPEVYLDTTAAMV